MPFYDFDCAECGEGFEELVRSPEAVKKVVCPVCGSKKVKKRLSMVAARVGGGSSESSYSAPACAPGGT